MCTPLCKSWMDFNMGIGCDSERLGGADLINEQGLDPPDVIIRRRRKTLQESVDESLPKYDY